MIKLRPREKERMEVDKNAKGSVRSDFRHSLGKWEVFVRGWVKDHAATESAGRTFQQWAQQVENRALPTLAALYERHALEPFPILRNLALSKLSNGEAPRDRGRQTVWWPPGAARTAQVKVIGMEVPWTPRERRRLVRRIDEICREIKQAPAHFGGELGRWKALLYLRQFSQDIAGLQPVPHRSVNFEAWFAALSLREHFWYTTHRPLLKEVGELLEATGFWRPSSDNEERGIRKQDRLADRVKRLLSIPPVPTSGLRESKRESCRTKNT